MSFSVFCLFFFFQAEDGIRDLTVTGVQTCALPICMNLPLGGTGFVQGTIHIEAMSHVSMFLDELFPGPTGLAILAWAPGAFFLRLSTRLPDISVVGLRGHYNERGDFLITTTPAIAE